MISYYIQHGPRPIFCAIFSHLHLFASFFSAKVIYQWCCTLPSHHWCLLIALYVVIKDVNEKKKIPNEQKMVRFKKISRTYQNRRDRNKQTRNIQVVFIHSDSILMYQMIILNDISRWISLYIGVVVVISLAFDRHLFRSPLCRRRFLQIYLLSPCKKTKIPIVFTFQWKTAVSLSHQSIISHD